MGRGSREGEPSQAGEDGDEAGKKSRLGRVVGGSGPRGWVLMLRMLGPHLGQACPCSQTLAVCMLRRPLSLLSHLPATPGPSAHSLWEDMEGQLRH